jgi:hypothetical protein
MTFQYPARRALPVSQAHIPGSKTPFFNGNGNINAASRKDWQTVVAHLADGIRSGNLTYDEADEAPALTEAGRTEIIQAALRDVQGGPAYTAFAASVREAISTQLEREGLMRQFLMPVSADGQIDPEIPIKRRGITAVVASGIAQVQYQQVRDDVIKPPSFEITTSVEWTRKDERRANGQWADRKTNEALEAVMVAEDRTFFKLVNVCDGLVHNTILYANLSPLILNLAINNMVNSGVPAGGLLLAADLWVDFANEASFQGVFSEVDKLEVFRTGRLGTVYGVPVFSEFSRRVLPELRVVEPGSFYLFAQPEYFGGYVDLGMDQAEKRVGDNQTSSRGVFLSEEIAIGIGNPAGVIHGIRR